MRSKGVWAWQRVAANALTLLAVHTEPRGTSSDMSRSPAPVTPVTRRDTSHSRAVVTLPPPPFSARASRMRKRRRPLIDGMPSPGATEPASAELREAVPCGSLGGGRMLDAQPGSGALGPAHDRPDTPGEGVRALLTLGPHSRTQAAVEAAPREARSLGPRTLNSTLLPLPKGQSSLRCDGVRTHRRVDPSPQSCCAPPPRNGNCRPLGESSDVWSHQRSASEPQLG